MSKSASRHSPVQRVSEVPNYWRTCSAGLVTEPHSDKTCQLNRSMQHHRIG